MSHVITFNDGGQQSGTLITNVWASDQEVFIRNEQGAVKRFRSDTIASIEQPKVKYELRPEVAMSLAIGIVVFAGLGLYYLATGFWLNDSVSEDLKTDVGAWSLLTFLVSSGLFKLWEFYVSTTGDESTFWLFALLIPMLISAYILASALAIVALALLGLMFCLAVVGLGLSGWLQIKRIF